MRTGLQPRLGAVAAKVGAGTVDQQVRGGGYRGGVSEYPLDLSMR